MSIFDKCYKNPDFEPFFKFELERLNKERPHDGAFELEYMARAKYKIYKLRADVCLDAFGGVANEYDYIFAVLRLRLPHITDENVKTLAENEIYMHYNKYE